MEDHIARRIRGLKSWDEIKNFEMNAKAINGLTTKIKQALEIQSTQLARQLVAEKTNIDVSILTPAEEKIIEVIAAYTALLKSQGKFPTRTFDQIRNRGLIGSAEESVTKSKPTQGFTALEAADLENLSYEQIILDHQVEFTQRALWFAKRTLGLPVDTDIPPVAEKSAVQTRTADFIPWIKSLASANGGHIPTYTNVAAANAMGIADTQKYGRVLGNIQSRIDYACLLNGFPPIGLAAEQPFDKSWSQESRSWAFPVSDMKSAALSRVWSDMDFAQILERTGELPGQAHLLWKAVLENRESWVKEWAFGLLTKNTGTAFPHQTTGDAVAPGNGEQENVSDLLTQDSIYTREDLMGILSTQDSTINTGVFRPAGFTSVLLFVTKDKTQDRTQYADSLDGEILHWQGQSKGRTDLLIIEHQQRGLELLVFYREKKYEHAGAGFRYEGRFKYNSHSGSEPADFILLREEINISQVLAEAEALGAFDPSNVDDARKKMLGAIVRRQGQPAFRRELLRAYEGQCAVTGCPITEVLEAAHIMPYRGPYTNHISNGILLRADLHTLFDLGLIAVDKDSNSLIVALALRHTDYGQWHGKVLAQPAASSDHPSAEALELHRGQYNL